MEPRWAREPEGRAAEVDPTERGTLLVELLELSDALPPVLKRDLAFPPFRTLVS